MDATVATGAAAMMAIRVLLDYDVPEENIQLVSLLMAEIGVHSIAYAFPKVKNEFHVEIRLTPRRKSELIFSFSIFDMRRCKSWRQL